METRILKISPVKAGGSAGQNTLKYRVGLPSQWVKAMGMDGAEKELLLTFDGEQITIRKNGAPSVDGFLAQALSAKHRVVEYHYYNGDQLCSRLIADFTICAVRVENRANTALIHTAFGVTEAPTWNQFLAFLEERCVPRSRIHIEEFLQSIGLETYDPVAIVAVTQGHMAEDDQWLDIIERW